MPLTGRGSLSDLSLAPTLIGTPPVVVGGLRRAGSDRGLHWEANRLLICP